MRLSSLPCSRPRYHDLVNRNLCIEVIPVQYPREKMGFRENGSFLANGTTFLTFYTSSKLEKWVFQKMGRLDDREENGTLTNLRESFVTFENRGL